MAVLVKGVWCPPCDESDLQAAGVTDEGFHNWITKDSAVGYTPDAGRYHLYGSWACPFAHRAYLYRSLLGLKDKIGLSIVAPKRTDEGWHFEAGTEFTDDVLGHPYLRDVYVSASSDFSGRVSVPVLWDKQTQTIVSNDSAEIMRMLDVAYNDEPMFFLPHLAQEIDELNQFMQSAINFGVYRCGFAEDQASYDKAFDALFSALDELDTRLGKQRYLLGEQLTECDWRLFTTLVRFDAVYFVHFKTNQRRIEDYPNLSNYLRELYQVPGVAETVDMDYIKTHYFYSHNFINPRRIIPRGPALDLNRPHNRDQLSFGEGLSSTN